MIDPVQFGVWHWWILGLVLGGLEMLAPGSLFLWLGIAAGATGAILLVAPGIAWQFQVLIFAVLSVASLFAWRHYQRRHPPETEDPTLNRRAAQYIGRVFTLDQAIVGGRGTVRVGDSLWRAEGPDLPAGLRVRVTGAAGTALQVEPAEEARPLNMSPAPDS